MAMTSLAAVPALDRPESTFRRLGTLLERLGVSLLDKEVC
jgi:hypothetical protein